MQATIEFELKSSEVHKLTIIDEPKTFGIGTRSFSVRDPDGMRLISLIIRQ